MGFEFNKQVEQALSVEEPSVAHKNVLSKEQLTELKQIALDFLGITADDIPTNQRSFWFRRGMIQLNPRIQELSDTVFKQFIPRTDAVLIGDTAFVINFPPHDIHIDCSDFRMVPEHQGIISYKSLVIPIEINCLRYPKFYTANQYFYGPTTRFRAGSEEFDATEPTSIKQRSDGIMFSYNYAADGMKYLSDANTLTKEWYDANIDAGVATPYSNFAGISIEAEHDWRPGDLIVFDSARIHFAQNIRKVQAPYKIGISLNYGIKASI